MTRPHRYIENQFVRLSRGTLHGLPLLMPALAREIRNIFDRDAHRFNITILALNVDPYGYEIIVFDPEMRRSDFLKSVNQCLSMKVKKTTDHLESVWANKKPGNTPILDLETLEEEIVRVCVSPIRKGYVRNVNQWELPHTGPSDWDEIQFEDPKREVSKAALDSFKLSEKSAKSIGPGLLGGAAVLAKIAPLKLGLAARISDFEKAEKRRRRRVLGVKACRKAATFKTKSLQKGRPYEENACIFLCADGARKSAIITLLKSYYKAYRQALVAFVKTKSCCFPAGVLTMRTLFGVTFLPTEDTDLFHFKFLG